MKTSPASEDTGSSRPRLSSSAALVCSVLLVVGAGQLARMWLQRADAPAQGARSPVTWRTGLPQAHDTAFHALAAHEYARSLREGVLSPRWAEPLQGGLGAPVFVFYPPAAYLVSGAVELLFGAGTATSLKVTLSLVGFASIAVMFLCSLRWWSTTGALAAAVFYGLSPWRALDLHERFAVPTHMAYLLLPLVFWATDRLLSSPSRIRWIQLAIVCGGLLLTHMVTSVLVLYGLGPYVIWRWWRSPRRSRCAVAFGLAGVVAALLAATLVLPAFWHRGEVDASWIRESEHGDFTRNFLWQHDESPGLAEPVMKRPAQWASGGLLVAGLLALGLWRWRRTGGRPGPDDEARPGLDPLPLGVLSVWLLLIQTPIASPLWSWAPGLAWAQFPWRFGGVQTLIASLLVGAAVSAALPRVGLRPLLCCAGLAVALFAFPIWWRFSASFWTAPDDFERLAPRLLVREYLPRRVGRETLDSVTAGTPRARLDGSRGRADVEIWQAEKRVIAVDTESATELTIGTFWFPGWRATLLGRSVPIRPVGDLGLIGLEVPAGRSRVSLEYGGTVATRAGGWVSIVSLLACLIALAEAGRRGRRADIADGSRSTSPAPPSHRRREGRTRWHSRQDR